jgi:MFS family permease
MQRYIRLLRENADFSNLWLAQVISLLGDWFSFVALSALVSRYSDRPGLAVSGLLLARFLPPLLVSPIAGVLVDRFNRKYLLMFSDLMRAALVAGMLLVTDREHLNLIYVLTVFQFILSAIFEPGRAAILPSLVSGDALLTANTLSNITWSVMLAIGAIIGGATAALLGTQAALVIDAASFGVSAFFISQIKTPQSPQARKHEGKSAGGFLDGLRYVMANPGVAAVLFIKLGLSIGSVDALMVSYATNLFVMGENGTGSLGILYSAFGIGAVIGPLVLNRYNDGQVRRMRRLVIISFAWVTVGWLLFGLAPTLLVAAAAVIVRAMGGSATWTYSSTIIQLSTENRYLGRVFSFDWMGYYLAVTISTLLTGYLIDHVGKGDVRPIAVGTGIVSIIPFVLWTGVVYWLDRRSRVSVVAAD